MGGQTRGILHLGGGRSWSLPHKPPPEVSTVVASSGHWRLRREDLAHSSPPRGHPQGTWRCHWHDRTPRNRGRGGPPCPRTPPRADQRSVAAAGPAACGDRSGGPQGKTMLLPLLTTLLPFQAATICYFSRPLYPSSPPLLCNAAPTGPREWQFPG